MLKLTKYEFRKNIVTIFVIIGIMIILELFFVSGIVNESGIGIASGFIIFALSGLMAFTTVFILGVTTYNKELSSKGSYLAFMTPNSPLKIIGSKLLFTFFVGILLAGIYAGFMYINLELISKIFEEEIAFGRLLLTISKEAGYDIVQMIYLAFASVVEFLIVFFMVVSIAYLSITLSLTLLANKRIKGFVSCVFFVAINVGVIKLAGFLPEIYENPDTIGEALITHIPAIIMYLVVCVIGILGSARLLERHVSL